jgi:hypothetical protein
MSCAGDGGWAKLRAAECRFFAHPLLTILAVLALCGGCGGNERERLRLDAVPIAAPASVEVERYGCPVTPEVCFRWAILRGPARMSGAELKAAERRSLVATGWRLEEGVTARAIAARSPGDELFLSFATGAEELADERSGDTSWGDTASGRRLRELVAQGEPVLAVTLERAASAR